MNEKKKKRFYTRWWFWVLAIIVVTGIAGGGEESSQEDKEKGDAKPAATQPKTETEKAKVKQEKTTHEIVKEIIYDKLGKKTNTGEKRIVELQVNDNAGTMDANDKVVVAKLYADENLSTNFTRKGILMDSKKILESLFKQKNISDVTLLWQFALVDKYGKESVDTILKISLDRQTADKINWVNFDYNNFSSVATQYFEHPALRQ